jgi:hypothetical protein
VEERPREVSGNVQGRPSIGLGRSSWAGRRSMASGLAASADGVRAGGRGSGAGVGHRLGGGRQEGSPGIGDSRASRGHRPSNGDVHVRPAFERERERVKGVGGSTPGRQDGRGVEELRDLPATEEVIAWRSRWVGGRGWMMGWQW